MQKTVANAISFMTDICDHRLENHYLMVPDFELTTPLQPKGFSIPYGIMLSIYIWKKEGMGGISQVTFKNLEIDTYLCSGVIIRKYFVKPLPIIYACFCFISCLLRYQILLLRLQFLVQF